jgi:hypothetical protein
VIYLTLTRIDETPPDEVAEAEVESGGRFATLLAGEAPAE